MLTVLCSLLPVPCSLLHQLPRAEQPSIAAFAQTDPRVHAQLVRDLAVARVDG